MALLNRLQWKRKENERENIKWFMYSQSTYREKVYVLADSMLNQLDQEKLSKKYDVIVQCHVGCTIRFVYVYLPHMIELKPEFVLIHVGANDCTTKTVK